MKFVLLIILFCVGTVSAVPAEVDDRVEYTTSLNSIASIVMNWYGSLITTNENVSFAATEKKWDLYRSYYPHNMTQIHITETDLTKVEGSDNYQFSVDSLVSYKNTTGEHSQLISETFIFQLLPFAQPIIKSISINKVEQKEVVHTIKFNRAHYKAREFAYAWIAYLDGVEMMQATIYADQWLDKASYSVKIGGDVIQGSVATTLAKRKQYLAKGGHLLRSLDIKKIAGKSNTFILDLIVEWKGINQTGKPVLAKIHQEIEYKIQDNNAWHVISIKEQHLLPDIAPWAGLLC
ncbi:MAG: hypothetical protein COB23_06130 [Methylophaga sp.]|nr:MAG: hypothetical protein COB23_06130 [Methylophaga sp.]